MTTNSSKLRQIWNAIHMGKSPSFDTDSRFAGFAEHLVQQGYGAVPVLDVGCGRGRHTRFLSQLGFNVFSCDWSLFALEVAQSHSQLKNQSNYSAADLTRLPYPNDCFAAVVCVHVLPYLVSAGIMQGIREMQRVLQPGGWLYADFLDRGDVEYGQGQQVEKHTFLDRDGIPVHFCSKGEISRLFRRFSIQRQYRLALGRRLVWEVWAQK